MPAHDSDRSKGFLNGIRVLELADELGEYCGKVLAGLGADVIKVEPPGGESTRAIGPFLDDIPNVNRSLHFWHYNFGKRSVIVDPETEDGQRDLRLLITSADVVIDTRHRSYLEALDLGWNVLHELNPELIYARISPFGDDGPWADYVASDLVHLALGGVMMNCGYDPTPDGRYDTPPIAPQMWQSYHIAGEQTAIAIVAALVHRLDAAIGQRISTSVHQAVSANTETDVPDWIYSRHEHFRQTCRHSLPQISAAAISRTKDGRWLLPYRTYLPDATIKTSHGSLVNVLANHGLAADLGDHPYFDPSYVARPEINLRIKAAIDELVGKFPFDADIWRDGQSEGLTWGPLRRPEENVTEEHWRVRGSVIEVKHPEVGKSFLQIGAKWYAPEVPWRNGPRAPLLGEHTEDILTATRALPGAARSVPKASTKARDARPLEGVRIIDLAWLLASGGAGRFFTALGADVIKVEHHSRPDAMRRGAGFVPFGGRAERDAATEPLVPDARDRGLNRSGSFMEINAGKRSLSLNLKTEEGKDILRRLIAEADMVIEGFSPGTMERMGFGYEELKRINPKIIYVQQSGMGQHGTYGSLRSYGPTAQAFSGLSEMSGLPEPYAPAGIGYSYLDWFGAYQMAVAMMAALYRQRTTGAGCWIDSSQVEAGLYLTGSAVLDWSANGHASRRTGNRSPHKPAAPHGAFRVAGIDRWIAISVFEERQWFHLARVLGRPDLLKDPRFTTLQLRLEHQDELESLIADAVVGWDGFELMDALQAVGVPSGVCQTAQDRVERDPQLRHLNWLVELPQSEIGTWPVKEIPVGMSDTPFAVGGRLNRHGPSYGEDTDAVLAELLGLSVDDIQGLRGRGVL